MSLKIYSIYWVVGVFLVSYMLVGCKKFLDVSAPPTSTNSEIVYASDATATAVLTGIFTRISQGGIKSGLVAMSFYPGLSSDELTLFPGVTDIGYRAYYNNQLTSSIVTGELDFWSNLYSLVYICNSALEGLNQSETLTPFVKRQLLGEAYFVRAYCYFYLICLYGDVPLALASDYNVNSKLPRENQENVINQIIEDLIMAEQNLDEEYFNADFSRTPTDRVRPNKYAAAAMLARVYLYARDYAAAEKKSSEVIALNHLYDTVPVSQVFLKTSKEAIWQIQSVDAFINNTQEARLFMLPEGTLSTHDNPVYLSEEFLKSFETDDRRLKVWIDSSKLIVDANAGIEMVAYYPFKYKNNIPFSPVEEYTIALRLAEQYLIRAEARGAQGDVVGGLTDLNLIRHRAGLIPLNVSSQEDFMTAVLAERKSELFSEWGHRWFDLKRMGLASKVLSSVKGSNWQDTDTLYPIPQTDIIRNVSLTGHQNPGY